MIGTEKCRNGDDWYEIQRKYTNEIHARLFRIFFLDKRHRFKIFGWVILILLTFLFIILLFHYIVLFFEYVHSTVALIFIPSDISLSCSIYWMFVCLFLHPILTTICLCKYITSSNLLLKQMHWTKFVRNI